MEKTYYYLYQVTDTLNNMIYVGIHATDNLNDGYPGSGSSLRRARKKYGNEHFKMEILAFFDNENDMVEAEKRIVTEDFIMRSDVYNQYPSSRGTYTTSGMAVVKMPDGSNELVSLNDLRYTSGMLRSPCFGRSNIKAIGKMPAVDKNGYRHWIDVDDSRLLFGDLKSITAGKSTYKDHDGRTVYTRTDDPRVLSGELISYTRGTCTMKDKDGNVFRGSIYDPKYISGEYVHERTGKYLGLTTVIDGKGIKSRVDKNDPRIQTGELIKWNPMSGKVRAIDKAGIKYTVSKTDERLLTGELVRVSNTMKGKVPAYDRTGEKQIVNKDDDRLKTGELEIRNGMKNKVCALDKTGKCCAVDKDDDRLKTGELMYISTTRKGKVPVKDKDGNHLIVDINDPRLQTGELTYNTGNHVKRKVP